MVGGIMKRITSLAAAIAAALCMPVTSDTGAVPDDVSMMISAARTLTWTNGSSPRKTGAGPSW